MRSSVLVVGIALALLGAGSALCAETPQVSSAWAPLAFLMGEWEGIGSGAPGATAGRFSFEPRVQGHALVRRNATDTPKGRHEDLMLIYQAPQGGIRAIYVDNEDHVINYTVTPAEEPKGAVFLSDEAPGTPRFRLSYRMNPDGTVRIIFDMAPPGSTEFKTYLEGSARKR